MKQLALIIVACLLGAALIGWVGYDYGRSKGIALGLARGLEQAAITNRESLERLRAESEAKVAAAQRDRLAAIEAQRLAHNKQLLALQDRHAEDSRKWSADLGALRQRVRSLQSTRDSESASCGGTAVPAPTTAAEAERAPLSTWMVSEGGGERILRLVEAAERVNAELALCQSQLIGRTDELDQLIDRLAPEN